MGQQLALLIITLIVGYFCIHIVAYLLHRLLHNTCMCRAYRAHKYHHEVAYPPQRFLSLKYENPAWYDSPLFYYLPISILVSVILFLTLPVYLAVILCFEGLVVGFLNDYLHSAYHIHNLWVERFSLFL
jgi:hypothetical protein